MTLSRAAGVPERTTPDEIAGMISTLGFTPSTRHPSECLPIAKEICAALSGERPPTAEPVAPEREALLDTLEGAMHLTEGHPCGCVACEALRDAHRFVLAAPPALGSPPFTDADVELIAGSRNTARGFAEDRPDRDLSTRTFWAQRGADLEALRIRMLNFIHGANHV